MSWKVLLPQDIEEEGLQLLKNAGHTIIQGQRFETEQIEEDLKAYQPDAMILREGYVTRKAIKGNPNLKVVVRRGTGFDKLDVQACHDYNVQALYAPGANSTSVAETALLLMLECSRNITVVHKTWVKDFYKAKLRVRKNTLSGKTVGVVGCGNVGSRLAKRALAMEMNVLAYDPFKPAKDFPSGVQVVRDFEELIKNSDYLSVHTPSTKETKKFINAKVFKLMKPTAFLINTSRGAVIDEDALYEACKNGLIMGAGLDVNVHEPINADNPLLTLNKNANVESQ